MLEFERHRCLRLSQRPGTLRMRQDGDVALSPPRPAGAPRLESDVAQSKARIGNPVAVHLDRRGDGEEREGVPRPVDCRDLQPTS